MAEVRAIYGFRAPARGVPRMVSPVPLAPGARLGPLSRSHVVAVVDCSAFYCSCERLFRPDLARTPIVVLSNNDGCIVARSQEAKALGIPMGAPYFKVRQQMEQQGVRVFSSNYALYGDLSRRVMEVLGHFTPDLEAYSIDEAFLRLPLDTPGRLLEKAHAIRERVLRWTGIPVHVGIGPTKTLAKVADELSRGEGGACALVAGDERLSQVEVGDVWGIGRQYAPRLRAAGVETAADLARVPLPWARRMMTVVGERLVRELRGEACLPIELMPGVRKSVMRSRSFSVPLRTCGEVERAVATYAARAAETVRASGLVAETVSVFLTTRHFGDGPHHEGARTVRLWEGATAYTPALVRVAMEVVRSLWRPGYGYKKAGVILGELRPAEPEQGHLFCARTPEETARERRLMAAMDELNARFGSGSVHVAAAAAGMSQRHEPWQMRHERRSPLYTTSWSGLRRVGESVTLTQADAPSAETHAHMARAFLDPLR